VVKDKQALFENNYFDIVLSIEVMEHVEDLNAYLLDVHRLIRPGGTFVWTTPCANRNSIEHMIGILTRSIENTTDGYRRWKWEESSHLRRMRSNEIRQRLEEIGFGKCEFRFRAHVFSYLCTRFCKGPLTHLGERLMLLDYLLFRRLPNGASMIGSARALDRKEM
jgi:ubiquinone/menaquinone biosynthesis C-methylase UbiE